MILTMVGVSRFAPNYVSALAFNGVEEGPVILKGLVDSGFSLQLVGATQVSGSHLMQQHPGS